MKNMILTIAVVIIAITLIALSSLFSNMLRYKNLCKFVAYECGISAFVNGFEDEQGEEKIKELISLYGLEKYEYEIEVENLDKKRAISVIVKSKDVKGKSAVFINNDKSELGERYEE